MPRKPTQKSPIRDLRAIIGKTNAVLKTQRAFAQTIGIKPGTLKRIENNDRRITRKIAIRIFAETGADIDNLLCGKLRPAFRAKLEGEYSPKFYTSWKERHFRADEEIVKKRTEALARWVGILLRAAAKKRRFWQVLQTLNETVDECYKSFGLAAIVDAILRDIQPRVKWNPFTPTPEELIEIEEEREHAEKQHEELTRGYRTHWDKVTPRKRKPRATKRQQSNRAAANQPIGSSAAKTKRTSKRSLKKRRRKA